MALNPYSPQGGIGDLLAQIEGDKSSAGTPRPAARTNTLPKRRADEPLRKEPAKTVRTGDKAASSLAIPSRPRPSSSDRPAPRTPAKPASRNGATGPRPASAARPSPSANAAPADSAPQKAPKKGSFAEIMARGQRAQATMSQVGKIQHKRIEKPAKKEKEEQPKDPRAASRKPGSAAANKPGSAPSARDAKDRKAPGPKSNRSPAADPEPKKKVRKPPPTTGYAGTARPRTAPAPSRASKPPAAGGVVLNPQVRRPSRAREDDEDSMDGFIIDDEDEEQAGPRYGYNDGYESSDMEAGMDEIDDEEAMAAAIARRDDLREEEMERRRKEEKERRKRRGW